MAKKKKIIEYDSDSNNDSENDTNIYRNFEEDDEEYFQTFKKSKSTKDLNIYGVFNGEYEETKSNKKSNINFVSSKVQIKETKTATFDKPIHKVDKDFGKFNLHSKGIGLKLMEKMGYKVGQGLGVEGKGIVEPLKTSLRPAKMGIAYKGYKENKQKEKEINKEEKEIINKISIKNKIQYKTVNELVDKLESKIAVKEKIVDMTGKDVKNLDNLNHISNEYKDDINLIIDLTKEEIQILELEAKKIQIKLENMNNELIKSEANQKFLQKNFDFVINEFETIIDEIISNTKNLEINNNTNLEFFRPYFNQLLEYYETKIASDKDILDKSIVLNNIREFLMILISNTIKRIVKNWDPIVEPDLFMDFFNEFDLIFNTFSKNDQDSNNYKEDDDYLIQEIEFSSFDILVYNVIYPKIRSSLINGFDNVVEDYDQIINLLTIWDSKLHTYIKELLIEQCIINKLKNKVESTYSKEELKSLHFYIHPWLPIINNYNKLEIIFQIVLDKFVIILNEWYPSSDNGFVIGLLKPWVEIIKNKVWIKFVNKNLIKKLKYTFINEFKINPSNQDLTEYTALIELYDNKIINPKQTLEILDLVFEKIYKILKIWLKQLSKNNNNEAVLEEIYNWYKFWKSLMPSSLFAYNDTLKNKLKNTLDLINEHID